MILNVRSINDETADYKNRYSGTYLHGELETQIGYDIFAFVEKTNFNEGVHKVIIGHTNRPATFFLWKGNDHVGSNWRGFLIYDTDEDFNYCEEMYKAKAELI